MRGKATLIVLLLVLGALTVVFSASIQRALWSTLVLSELLNFESRGWLAKWTSPPRIEEFLYKGPSGWVKADLYFSQPEKKCPGILLNHGVVDTGKDDPRLRRFAEILCRSGFVVLVPDFKGMRSFHIAPSDIDEIQAAYENFISLRKYVLPQSCGLFGFSYGAGPTMIAAGRPAMRQKVRFVVSFGGYWDLKNVIAFLATGKSEFGGKTYYRKPQEYGKWVFLANNLHLVDSPEDRSILRNILQLKLRDEKVPLEQFSPLLGEEGKNILTLLSPSKPQQIESLIQKLPPDLRASMEALSVGPALNFVQADLILAHGEDDDMIPFTETLRLAQATPNPHRVYLQILRSYSHVDPHRQTWTLKNFIRYYLPEGWKLFGLVYKLMEYRQGKS
jgi:dienelactone hydrolase